MIGVQKLPQRQPPRAVHCSVVWRRRRGATYGHTGHDCSSQGCTGKCQRGASDQRTFGHGKTPRPTLPSRLEQAAILAAIRSARPRGQVAVQPPCQPKVRTNAISDMANGRSTTIVGHEVSRQDRALGRGRLLPWPSCAAPARRPDQRIFGHGARGPATGNHRQAGRDCQQPAATRSIAPLQQTAVKPAARSDMPLEARA